MKYWLFIVPFLFFASGCKKNPVGDLLFPDPYSGSYGKEWVIFGGTGGGSFGEGLRTRNGIMAVYPLTDYWQNHENELDLENSSQKHSGKRSFYLSWNGDASKQYANNNSVFWVGAVLYDKNFIDFDNDNGIDLPDSYKGGNLRFWIKVGRLYENVVFRVDSDVFKDPDNPDSIEIKYEVDNNEYKHNKTGYDGGIPIVVSDNITGEPGAKSRDAEGRWVEVVIPILNVKKIKNVASFSLVSDTKLQTNGGYLYIDDVAYVSQK
jgi:hypothetical protein